MRISKLLQMVPAALALTLSAPALAGDGAGPEVPKALKGEECVEPTSDMRRNHMEYLKHHRDEALREGIRTKQYSLKQCLECHVAPEGSPQAAQDSGEHFCAACHKYAGVTIDCFQCHATQPKETPRFHPLVTPGMKAMEDLAGRSGELLDQLADGQASKKRTGAIQ